MRVTRTRRHARYAIEILRDDRSERASRRLLDTDELGGDDLASVGHDARLLIERELVDRAPIGLVLLAARELSRETERRRLRRDSDFLAKLSYGSGEEIFARLDAAGWQRPRTAVGVLDDEQPLTPPHGDVNAATLRPRDPPPGEEDAIRRSERNAPNAVAQSRAPALLGRLDIHRHL